MDVIRLASPVDFIPALEILFQELPPEDAFTRIVQALELLQRDTPEAPHLLLAEEDGEIAGVILLQALVGATGVVWPPQISPDASTVREFEDLLVQKAVAWLRQHGAKLAQAVVYTDEMSAAQALERNGFSHPTQLWYFRHELELSPEQLCAPETLTFQNYTECDHGLFQQILWRSYEQTRDFPEVSGRRSISDVVAGLQAVGFDPARWWLAWHDATAVGVLVLSAQAEEDVWELSYVGVLPEARGHGIGRELVRKALFEAKAAGGHEVILSVDCRNEPALNLYQQLGFEIYDRREVYLALW
jgi:ribosomal protein S18 acetylase RimI-like enzyme